MPPARSKLRGSHGSTNDLATLAYFEPQVEYLVKTRRLVFSGLRCLLLKYIYYPASLSPILHLTRIFERQQSSQRSQLPVMMFTKLLPMMAFFYLLSLCAASSDILGVAQSDILVVAPSAVPAVITKTPSSGDLATMDSSTLTQPPMIATALPTALPKTTSTTMVHGYTLLILPPEPVSYNTTNYTTSTTTVFSYAQPSAAPNVTFPSPKKVKDLAEIIVPSVLGGGAVVGGMYVSSSP